MCRVSAPFRGTRALKAWHLFRLVSAFGLASIASRIAESLDHYTEDDGDLINDSNDPMQWLHEQALRADIRPPIRDHVLDYESEDTTSEDDSKVRVGGNKHSTLTETMVHRMPHQLVPSKI